MKQIKLVPFMTPVLYSVDPFKQNIADIYFLPLNIILFYINKSFNKK
jgi:hypothetical protein